ncbi:hypothetical protein [Formosimonas limnophila]|uniref:hypothetical protein n=1 Tax=Formosimonas limnophila TaxID=1384487 RepID=UPI0016745BE2|nr:hypothetical protein [Formosimonas limnophila]
MLINDSPLGLAVEGSCKEPIFLPDFCDPCYFEQKFLPRLISPSKKDNTVLKELFKSALSPLEKIAQAVCGVCISAESEDCECFMTYYTLIGGPTSIVLDTTDDTCLVPIGKVKTTRCGVVKECNFYCKPFCSTCETKRLTCENDIELMRKIARVLPRWQRMAPSRKNVEACLTEWFGRRCVIVSDTRGKILWISGHDLSTDEKAYLPFVYSILPILGGVEITHVFCD